MDTFLVITVEYRHCQRGIYVNVCFFIIIMEIVVYSSAKLNWTVMRDAMVMLELLWGVFHIENSALCHFIWQESECRKCLYEQSPTIQGKSQFNTWAYLQDLGL